MRFNSEKEFQEFMQNRRQGTPCAPPMSRTDNPLIHSGGFIPPDEPQAKKGKQTKTEIEAGNMLKMEFQGCNVVPWGFRITMLNGHAYTPDYLVWPVGGRYMAVEVKQRGKNGFRQNSYQRAKLAFDQCKTEHPLIIWRWMEKHCGQWAIKDY